MSFASESAELVAPLPVAYAEPSMAGAGDYLALLKPRVMSLVVFTALTGMVVAPVPMHPVLGFFAPLYGGLAFIHYGLARLDALRTAPIEGVAQRVEE